MPQQIYESVLPDEQMRAQLERGEIFFFKGPGNLWQSIDRQIERLGFGDSHFVSCVESRRGKIVKITPNVGNLADVA